MGICRTPSLKQVSPGYTLRICACFLSISFLMICGGKRGGGGHQRALQDAPGPPRRSKE